MADIAEFKVKCGGDDRFCTLKKAVSKTAEAIDVPAYAEGKYITAIGGGAFKKCPRIKTAVIPHTVTTLERKAFAGSSIESIVIPQSVTEVGDRAFEKCVYLRDVSAENPDTVFGKSVFDGCYGIKRAKLPVAAFVGRWFTTVAEATVVGVGDISDGLFKDCGALRKITVCDGITAICEKAFSDCDELAEVVLPDGLTEIWSGAFCNCSALKSFTLPKGVTSLGYDVFSGCAMKRLKVDKDNEVYADGGNCIIHKRDKKLVVGCADSAIPDDGSVEIIDDGAFCECGGLEAIVIPSAVKCIGDHAFSGCDELKDLVISEGAEVIADFAFAGCSHLQTLNLPSTLKELGYGVFEDCDWLTDVYYNGTTADWNNVEKCSNIACSSSFVLHCTDGDIADYK